MKISEEVGSKYRYIILAGQRVAQLQKGAQPKVDDMEKEKNTAIATHELNEGLLKFHKIDLDEDGEGGEEAFVPPKLDASGSDA